MQCCIYLNSTIFSSKRLLLTNIFVSICDEACFRPQKIELLTANRPRRGSEYPMRLNLHRWDVQFGSWWPTPLISLDLLKTVQRPRRDLVPGRERALVDRSRRLFHAASSFFTVGSAVRTQAHGQDHGHW